ncbi:MAG: YigZ family protein [Candidatus Marinimicrobia bacterium]|nr:YigZ family protein [Candidatus Neomarinimicrobiota bacterium]MBT3936185.1 YigZ family protein [Candidatus Neomarinimicrobiota bacterium]MBT3960513.1 YigZ family protein [Candidatus Neomarinimicrobiota bacterium]MBT4384086.1 YigZ family protein [Candidatus Neomarinimicrobiota bacterium]MBT4637057.1 YigZ family protein [Candidatus Neomarinimicrobiota bacterium]
MKYTIQKKGTSVYKEKQSEFIGHIYPFSDITQFRFYLKDLKKEYHDARHFCWAYRIQGSHEIEENTSDAGEPNGTAGLPILHQLKQVGLVNVGLIVIRYFGGIKLGKRGLIESYGQSASDTIQTVKRYPFQDVVLYKLTAPMDFYGPLSSHLSQLDGKIIEDQSAQSIVWKIEYPRKQINHLIKMVIESTHGHGILEPWNG